MNDKELALLKLYSKKLLAERQSNLDLSKEIEQSKDKDYGKAREIIRAKIDEAVPKVVVPAKARASPSLKTKVEKTKEERQRELEKLNRIVEESNKSIKCENTEINQYYERLRKSVEMVVKGYLNSTFVQGRTGTGKTFQIISTFNALGLTSKDYTEFQGEMSSAYVYRFVCENNGKIIIFRDLVNLMTALRSLELLKAMTETKERRMVMKGNYSKETAELPPSFECTSRFIFEFNALRYNGLKEDIEALIGRGDYVNLSLSFGDIANIMLQIAKTEEEKEVSRFLIRNYKFVGLNALNLRTQQKAFKIYEYAKHSGNDWKKEMMLFLTSEMSGKRRTLYNYMGDRVLKSSELKKIMVLANIDGANTLRSADRRLREYVLMGELFIVGFVSHDEEELENYLNSHRNFAVSLNPIEAVVEVVEEPQPQATQATEVVEKPLAVQK